MTGGVLLPGSASTADVASGKTFSSQDGFNIAGVATLATKGMLGQRPTSGWSSSAAQSFPISFPNNVPTTDSVILGVHTGEASGTGPPIVSSVSGLGATWTKLTSNSNVTNNTELWLGSTPDGTGLGIGINLSSALGSGQIFQVFAADIFGVLTLSVTASGYSGSINTPANGIVASIVGAVSSTTNPGFYGYNFPIAGVPLVLSLGDGILQSSSDIGSAQMGLILQASSGNNSYGPTGLSAGAILGCAVAFSVS